MAHFILEAVELVEVAQFRTNERACGSAQFPPRMMLALLVYCYSHGLFGSRRIEAATHSHLSLRYLAGNTHPDHDTICKFRRENFEAIASFFCACWSWPSRSVCCAWARWRSTGQS